MSNSKRRLPLVEPQNELSGKFPLGFEKAVRSALVGDATHRAVIQACITLSRESGRRCLPPSVEGEASKALDIAATWAKTPHGGLSPVRQGRGRLYESLQPHISTTVRAISEAVGSVPESAPYFRQHSHQTVLRYIGLSVHYTLACTTETCDAVSDPLRALEVAKAFSASIAYRNVALGAARDASLHRAATDQATWEHATLSSSAPHSVEALRLQLFHEYLGVHWKNAVDAHRLYAEQFLQWAFPEPC